MVNYKDFIESAEQLLQTGEEIGYRNAVSRAYYALYHRCIPLFNEINDRPVDDHHAQIVRTLRQQPQYKSIANRLNNLRKRRNTADYELHKTLPYYGTKSGPQNEFGTKSGPQNEFGTKSGPQNEFGTKSGPQNFVK